HSAIEINRLREEQGSLWLDESFDRIVRDEKEFTQKRDYMEANPVTADLAKPGEYSWFWGSDTNYMECVREGDARLETGHTGHRLETGATESMTHAACACFIK